MQDSTGGASGRAIRSNTAGNPRLDAKLRELVNEIQTEKPRELIAEMMITALKMAHDQTSVADLKMLNRALKELRFAVRVFAPYRDRGGLVSAARARRGCAGIQARAEDFGRKMRDRGT